MEEVLRELLKTSPLLAAFGLYIWRLHKDLRHTQNQRTADVQAMFEKVMALNEKWNTSIGSVVNALDSQKELLSELKDAMRDLSR